MKLEYKHRAGGGNHTGPSGQVYDFKAGEDGRRMAEVDCAEDQARFLSLLDGAGEPLFAVVDPSSLSAGENPDSLANVVDLVPVGQGQATTSKRTRRGVEPVEPVDAGEPVDGVAGDVTETGEAAG